VKTDNRSQVNQEISGNKFEIKLKYLKRITPDINRLYGDKRLRKTAEYRRKAKRQIREIKHFLSDRKLL